METTTHSNQPLTAKQVKARSFYFAQYVADFFSAFHYYPNLGEMRPLFIYATRKALFYPSPIFHARNPRLF